MVAAAMIALALSGGPASADDVPRMKYECVALIGQDWFRGKHDTVYARTKPFFMTEKELASGVTLNPADFSEFFGTDPEQLEIKPGKTVTTRGQTTFEGSDLGKGFSVSVQFAGNWDKGEYKNLKLQSLVDIKQGRKKLSVGSLIGRGTPKGMGVLFENDADGRPKAINTGGSIYLEATTKRSGPVHVRVSCSDKLGEVADKSSSAPNSDDTKTDEKRKPD